MTTMHRINPILTACPDTAPSFRLDIEHDSGALDPQQASFPDKQLVIGRTADTVTLAEGGAPLRCPQAEIRWQAGLFWLIDRAGEAVTRLNGRCIQAGYRYSLHHGDSITVGDYRIGFRLQEAGSCAVASGWQ
jgi:predicted component of type VI protein secretion system